MTPQIQCRPVPVLWVIGKRRDPFFNTPTDIRVGLASGDYRLVVVDGGAAGPDAATVASALVSGDYRPVVVDASANIGLSSVAAAISSGEYKLVVVDGGNAGGGAGPDHAIVSAALSSGTYILTIVSSSAPANTGAISASISSGSYALA